MFFLDTMYSLPFLRCPGEPRPPSTWFSSLLSSPVARLEPASHCSGRPRLSGAQLLTGRGCEAPCCPGSHCARALGSSDEVSHARRPQRSELTGIVQLLTRNGLGLKILGNYTLKALRPPLWGMNLLPHCVWTGGNYLPFLGD